MKFFFNPHVEETMDMEWFGPNYVEQPDSVRQRLMRRFEGYSFFLSNLLDCNIYINTNLIKANARIGQIADLYQGVNNAKTVRVTLVHPSEIYKHSLIENPQANSAFLRRGYVSNDEFANVGRGGSETISVLVTRNRAAADHHLSWVAALYPEYDPRSIWRKKHKRNLDDLETNLELIVGKTNDADMHLVRRNGVLLPATTAKSVEPIIPCYCEAVHVALSSGQKDSFNLTLADASEITEQVRFESAYSTELFNGATIKGITFWQMQVAFMLRVSAWHAEFESSLELLKHRRDLARSINEVFEVQKANDLLDEVTQRLRDIPHVAEALEASFTNLAQNESLILSALDNKEHKTNMNPTQKAFGIFEQEYNQYIKKHGSFPTKFVEISDEDELLSAIHGATYQSSRCCMLMSEDELHDEYANDPFPELYIICTWIGKLKRHRHSRVDASFAMTYKSCEEKGGFDLNYAKTILNDSLSLQVWEAISFAVAEILEGLGPNFVDVVYIWTKDLRAPRGVSRDQSTIFATGPLLHFPISRVDHWNKAADKYLYEKRGILWFNTNTEDACV